VDVERFLRELPALFDDYPRSERPRDGRFRGVLEEVPGLATENCLALLNLAAACLGPGEAYVEAGSFRGTSLVAAGLGNDVPLVGIDRFSMEGSDRATLEANLARFGVTARIVEGEVREALRAGALAGVRVGVFYYDAEHTREALLDALGLVEPSLAPRALIVVDDADWERVAGAVEEYLAGQPRSRLVLELRGKEHGMPQWWEGVQVLAWEAG
jgi:predicted O-methyltransferase YrrM